ncbi:MAG TPA: TetR/AcrR family transcriptional regulator [Spirochaetota bacterium]|nr:TetR/AcrR family transcriptional regulator [Spirochaetota bacterium]HPJ38586.1 TetR/AcrR family transcriptional regulator [Spirochaetota bacterium]HPQ54469.1 TetR/AcrR family transcriptional regulator [Spirochaetota bacterium]
MKKGGTDMGASVLTYQEFRDIVEVSMEKICRAVFHENRDSIKIKKEEVAVKNLINIFNTTLELSNTMGFQAMSLRDLSRESGLSMGALYSYFTGKDELAKIIQEQGRRIIADILKEQVEKGNDPREQLQIAIRAHLFLNEVMQKWFYFSFMEARNLSREEQKRAIESELVTESMFIDILDSGIEKGLFRVGNTVLTASTVKAMLQDWYLKRWKYSRRKVTVEDYADFIINLIESFIMPKETQAG